MELSNHSVMAQGAGTFFLPGSCSYQSSVLTVCSVQRETVDTSRTADYALRIWWAAVRRAWKGLGAGLHPIHRLSLELEYLPNRDSMVTKHPVLSKYSSLLGTALFPSLCRAWEWGGVGGGEGESEKVCSLQPESQAWLSMQGELQGSWLRTECVTSWD